MTKSQEDYLGDDDDHDDDHDDDDDDDDHDHDHDDDHDDPPLPCFTAGTLIATDVGEQPVESLAVGDLVWTLDAGLQPIRWIAQRLVTLADQRRDARLCPVVFEPGALGPGMP
ncbi:MAG: Hint domain-containing protein, partial [Pseudorhodobacter sp.]|nr:Hint domain-containing protein [Pseudorhodobacter sp.]